MKRLKQIMIIENYQDSKLTKSEMRKSIIKFTWPCIAELMLLSLISIVNLSMVGHLGAYALSAVGLTSQPVFISIAVFQAFNVGATALVSRFIGAKDYQNARKVVTQSLIFGVVSGTFLSILGFIFSNWLVVKMGAQGDTVYYANIYMKYMAIGTIFQSIPTAVSSILRGAGDSKSPMRFNVVSNIVNAIAGYIFIYGFGFVPSLGVEGAGIAATLAKLTACVLSIYTIFNTNLPIAISIKDSFKLDFLMLKRIVNIGFAAAGEQLVMRVGFLIYTKIIADLGTISFAAHQVCLSISGLSSNLGMALGMASTSFVGRNLGANNPDLAERYSHELRKIAVFCSLIISLFFFFGGFYITRIFISDMEVILISAFVLKIIAFITPPQNTLFVLTGGLRGAGDTKWPLISSLSGIAFIRLPLAFILVNVFNFGLAGAWTGAVIDQYIRVIVIYVRFARGKWKSISV